ncbi:DUF3099 domain-containing protein [Microbacterium sp. ZXX196]|uniref:DUF3099 domain-containing protein n=1 Tax=Microbacterium sp. ZXX196 TaxID=2609291 RepID=UPI0034D20DA1
MKTRHTRSQTATSIPASPEADETARMRQYVITMAIRTVCVVLMFAIQPWGWHTAVLGIGAIFLPYFAVVIANQAQSALSPAAERPEIAIEAARPAEPTASDEDPAVFRMNESGRVEERP